MSSDAQTRILFSLLTVPPGFVHCEGGSLQIPNFPSIREAARGWELQPGQAALLSCSFLGIAAERESDEGKIDVVVSTVQVAAACSLRAH